MTYNIGSKVKCKMGAEEYFPCEGTIIGEHNGYICVKRDDGVEGSGIIYNGKSTWDIEETGLILIRKGVFMMKNMKYGISYEKDADPVELFASLKERNAWIDQLLEDAEVDKSKIYVFEVKNIKRVVRPIKYELVNV